MRKGTVVPFRTNRKGWRNTMLMKGRLRQHRILAMVVMLIVATMAVPVSALAKTVLDYDPSRTINPVADNITRLNVNKLEKGAQDYVEGAHMAIFEKETGKMVTEWITNGSVHEVARNTDDPNRGALDVDVVYILRELEAPEGYKKAADVEFVIHSDNFNTSGEILSGADDGNADSEEIRGSGPQQAFVINLYDEAYIETEEVETRERRKDREVPDESEVSEEDSKGDSYSDKRKASVTPKTGDETSYASVIMLVCAGVALNVVALRRRS